MLTYLALGDWADVLEEGHIPSVSASRSRYNFSKTTRFLLTYVQ